MAKWLEINGDRVFIDWTEMPIDRPRLMLNSDEAKELEKIKETLREKALYILSLDKVENADVFHIHNYEPYGTIYNNISLIWSFFSSYFIHKVLLDKQQKIDTKYAYESINIAVSLSKLAKIPLVKKYWVNKIAEIAEDLKNILEEWEQAQDK